MAKGELYLASEIHLPDGEAKKDREGRVIEPVPLKVLPAGTMLSEHDAKLDEKTVKELRVRGVLRPPTAEEMEAAEQRQASAKSREAQLDARLEAEALRVEQANERRRIEAEADREKQERLAKLSEEQSEELAEANEKVAAASGADRGSGSGSKGGAAKKAGRSK